ncbi:Dam family site-specific DNA-(adenine-N6)-methyltransferase [Legionella sp. 16cNR16C]|uniref:Dam family site-specific DNA-(adenine-N6)-methyltransferase n=1 Tax=Legionella sp. 16cNR16C TaxID=2905656 RepID=UPI001E2A7BE3|nr:Dam family site-specific DNA-(adenine-N6)-methyltransferase [Legionella sp. 16cNR16C]MCE3044588.1 Dam family site-specific DNA-(adenine-N6)-methyltransferase [Legionella sp. 16cNR16C]
MVKYRPFLKWAGNKYHCLNHILTHLKPARRLIEPFTGSGAVFINSVYDSYLLAENNPDLVHLYQMVQNEGDRFISDCAELFTAENNVESLYYQYRDEFNHCTDIKRRGALFLYLNRHGYNGLCRYNKSGIYNVPFGRYKKPYFPRKELLNFYQQSQKAEFLLADFRSTFAQAKAGDIIYCDPPYVPLSRSSNFSSYTRTKFYEQDQIDLAILAKQSAEQGITVLISNHDTEFTRHHYKEGQIITLEVPRMISCNAENRQMAKELIAVFNGYSS